MDAGQVRSVYLTLHYYRAGDRGVVAHEIQISNDGKPLLKSTPAKPDQPDKLLFDKTQMPAVLRFSCQRIGSKLYMVSNEGWLPENVLGNLAYVLDAKSSGELVKLHELPSIDSEDPNIIAAHGRLYHLARPANNTLGRPMPFEVYDPSTKSWDPLPPLPQSPFVPYAEAPRRYFGYAVWGSCILFSLGFPDMTLTAIFSVPVLFNAESRTWHQVYVKHNMGGVDGCFPWLDKAVVVGDTIYALGFKRGTIISFSITKSGSEEDGTLSYSLTTPYFLNGLKIISHPKYKHRKCILQCWSPLGDFEFCLVQTTTSSDPKCQPFFITTFKIIHKEGTFSHIESLFSALQFMGTQGYGHFVPLFCYNPDYEPEEVKLTMKEEIRKERNMLSDSSPVVDCDILDVTPKEASFPKIKGFVKLEDGKRKIIEIENRGLGRVFTESMSLWEEKKERLTDEKVDMQSETNGVKCSPCNVECLKPDFRDAPSMVDSNSRDSKQVIRRKRKGKRSKKKGSDGPKRDSCIVSFVKHQVSTVKSYGSGKYGPTACLIFLSIGLTFSLPETREVLFLLMKGIGI